MIQSVEEITKVLIRETWVVGLKINDKTKSVPFNCENNEFQNLKAKNLSKCVEIEKQNEEVSGESTAQRLMYL